MDLKALTKNLKKRRFQALDQHNHARLKEVTLEIQHRQQLQNQIRAEIRGIIHGKFQEQENKNTKK